MGGTQFDQGLEAAFANDNESCGTDRKGALRFLRFVESFLPPGGDWSIYLRQDSGSPKNLVWLPGNVSKTKPCIEFGQPTS